LFNKTKNVAGIAFQLVDDWLDFVSTAEQLGKFAAMLQS
jgi:geranylgeranyl pyrophosphate synthase